jgi:hypothetical protein
VSAPSDGLVHIVSIRGTFAIRRLQLRADGGILAVCDNPAVKVDIPDIIRREDVVARALWVSFPAQ